MEQIDYVEKELLKSNIHMNFGSGDTVTVHYKIKEGDKEKNTAF